MPRLPLVLEPHVVRLENRTSALRERPARKFVALVSRAVGGVNASWRFPQALPAEGVVSFWFLLRRPSGSKRLGQAQSVDPSVFPGSELFLFLGLAG